MDFAGGAARAGIRHLPEIGLWPHARDPAWIDTHFVDPHIIGFVVVLIHGEDQPLRGQLIHFRQQFVGVDDRLALEIIAKAEVAEHFKKGMVAR